MEGCKQLWSLWLLCTVFMSMGYLGNADIMVAGPPPNALFVFGDSYVDTGNRNKTNMLFNQPWHIPYGHTWPGSPDGRFSDGHVFSEFFALALQIPSPIPYEQRVGNPSEPKYGMNFAIGGAGVLNSLGISLTVSGQVSQFSSLVGSIYPKEFLAQSVALIGLSGNDYAAYLLSGGTAAGVPAYITSVVQEVANNLKRLYALGLHTFYVNNLQPLGCLPSATRPGFKACDEFKNSISTQHNEALVKTIAQLRSSLPGSTFTILDQYKAFTTILLEEPSSYGLSKPLLPCCLGAELALKNCGDVGANGKPLYTICADPSQSFFWDSNHPGESGWKAVSKFLFPVRGANESF